MTISSTANRISYAGNGSTTAFSFPYLFFADDDLKVVLVVDATGVETTKLLTTHYTVAGETVAAGGTVTMGTAPASGETLVIIRQEQFTQGLDLVENDPFPSDNVEQQFDILTMLSQQLNDEVSRSFKLSDGDTSGANLTVATPTADQLVGWDNAGLTLENKDPADITNMSIYYLGPYASNPTTNNAGGVLVEGNIYFDTANDYFKVYDGSAWVIGLSARTWATFTYTAAGAETSVSGADDDAATLAYTAGQIRVFLNGVLLDDADYTATTGTSITGLAALSASDILFVEAYDNVAVLGTMADQNASAVAITGGTITGTTGAAQTITALTATTINGVNAATAQYTTAEETKLSAIEALADVTDATNVTAAGALMDSELTSLADVKAIDQGLAQADSPTFGGLTIDDINLNGKVLTIIGSPDDTFKITAGADGDTTLATVDTAGANGHLRLDADGLIILDGGDTYGQTLFYNKGVSYGNVYENSNSLHIKSVISDANIHFQGNDGGSTITALTLDMSEAGKAIFNAGATFADDVTVENINLSDKVLTITGDTGDTFTITTGAAGATTLATTDAAGTDGALIMDADGYIRLDSDGPYGSIYINKGATNYGEFFTGGTNFNIRSNVNNGDIRFDGKDDGSLINALTLDMSEAGKATFNDDVVVGDNIFLSSDSSHIFFGASNEIRLSHVHNSGLTLKHTATADDNPITLTLQTGETDIAADDVIGAINFQAPDEGAGTDAILVAAGIEAVSEGDFSSSNNATRLSFKTGASEAAAEKMTLSSAGNLGIGTTAPVAKLQINTELNAMSGTNVDVSNLAQNIHNPQNDNGEAVGIGFGLSTYNTNIGAAITHERTAGHSKGKLHFATKSDEVLDADIPIRMTIDPDGNIGIGTTTPASQLHIVSTAAPASDLTMLTLENGNGTGDTITPDTWIDFAFKDSNANVTPQARIGAHAGTGGDANTQELEGSGYLTFHTSNTTEVTGDLNPPERVRISSAGYVGIGNTAPTSTLHVTGDATVDDINLDGKVITITGSDNDTFTITAGANGATTLRTTDAAGSSGTFTLVSDGMLDYSAGDTYGQHRFYGAGTMFTTLMKSSGNSGTDFAIRNNVSDGDILLVGNDGGSYVTGLKLDMSEAGKATFGNDVNPAVTETQDLGSATFEWDNIFVQNAVTVSDARKKNIVGGITWGTDLLRAMGPKVYTLKDTVIPAHNVINAEGEEQEVPEMTISHDRPHTGFVAQEVKAAMDSIGLDDWAGYAYDDDNDTHALRLMEMTGVLVQGWKDLDARIAALETA